MYFEIDGANINYALDGPEHAPLVVHWNGANCALGMWDEAIPRINGHFRSLRFDARGIGSSSPASNPVTDYTFERYIADVNAIVDSLGVESITSGPWPGVHARRSHTFHSALGGYCLRRYTMPTWKPLMSKRSEMATKKPFADS